VTRPRMPKQAVAQPQARPPRIVDQWYAPPALGNADAAWAIVSATAIVKRKQSGQPTPIDAPPAPHSPAGNDVRPPDSTQIVAMAMAKLENQFMLFSSSGPDPPPVAAF